MNMTEEEFEHEVACYQNAIPDVTKHFTPFFSWREEAPVLVARFEALWQGDRTDFRKICIQLLQNEQREVRLGTIALLHNTDRRPDRILSSVLINIAFKEPELRENALWTLYPTYIREALPQLLLFAEKGYTPAIFLIRRLIQTPEEIERAIALGRKYIMAKNDERPEGALFLLQKYSTMDQAAEHILPAVRRYTDTLFIAALRDTSPDLVLELMKDRRDDLVKTYPNGKHSAEYGDVSATIAILEQKKEAFEEGRQNNE